jgi:hypothetical protein
MAATAVLGCDDRIPSAFIQPAGGGKIEERFDIDPRRDLVLGPLGFSGLRTYDNAVWDDMVKRDQWLKALPKLRPGARVTIEVPRSQRGWMKLAMTGLGAGRHRVTLQACTREEGRSGPSGNTAWSGGFEIDYAKAPKQGRCARITVRTGDRVIRKRIAPAVTGC